MNRINKHTRVLLAFFICFIGVSKSSGQKNDYIWLQGYDSNDVIDSATYGFRYGISILNFNSNPITVSYDSIQMNFNKTNTSYCNNDGNLLFYSDGLFISDSLNQMIQNSNGMNQGYVDEIWDPTIMELGYSNSQGIIAIQNIAGNNQYYLIYSYDDSVPGSGGSNIYTPQILSAYLDMSANNGLGDVAYKNQPILQGDLGQEISAVKHGNGIDWWVIIQKRNTNCYYSILLTDTGFQTIPNLTCGGPSIGDADIASAAFSPDGSKYAHFDPSLGVNIFDFDRCTGELSNPLYYPLNIWGDSSWLGNGVAFSPNSRFLYISATKVLLQFDMWASDIAQSVDTVGIYDGFKLPFGSYFDIEQLAPDGKIYISCGNSEADYHVINNPNSKGDSCNFEQHALRLPTLSSGVPTFPNYRLGALTGSACDTITGLNEVARAAKEQILKVFPNPANDAATVDYGFTDWNKGQPDLEICNALGQTVYTQVLPMYSGFQKIDVSRFAAGMYSVFIKRNNGVVATQKLVKE